MQNFIEQKIKFDQKMKISNARVYLNEIYKTTFLFETRFKKRRQLHDHSFYNQFKLKKRILQRTHVNEHRYITSIVQRHYHEINQLNNCTDRRDACER